MKIGLDIMGGDFAPETTVAGALLAQKELSSDVTLVLIGKEDEINARLNGFDSSPFEIVNADEVIEMGDSPTKALSQKQNSGIALGFKMLRSGELDGFASTGNSGAMLVGAVRSVGAIPGIYRPCVVTPIPKMNGSVTILLDVGINADCKPDVLYQFAILGSLYAESVYNIKTPRVGLLNIGEEESKGNLLTQSTHGMMKGTKDFNFVGNVEGRDLFNEDIDVIVCDGFTGNVVLKEIEAFYEIFKKRGISDEYLDQFNYETYGGTPFLGINSPVVIGHGASSDVAVKNMIVLTKEIIESQISDRIKEVFG
ncbi:MAG: phosphate acyltransferase PlsX [Flavobacteriales bacterium]|nr:phosphate acyltransferase PlsX [Flavobacteriales bacterium]